MVFCRLVNAEIQHPLLLAVFAVWEIDPYNRGAMQFRVDQDLFQTFPEVTIGVVIATGIDNRGDGDAAAFFLREQVEAIRSTWSLDRLETESRIASWREAYRTFGAKPNKHRCSVESAIRMILDGGEFPSINRAVDVYNAISLKHCVPAGGDDLDRVVGDIALTFAKGDERFVPLNGTESMPPKPGEVIYRDDADVLCRRWNWRECDKTKMTVESTNLCLVVEGLPPVCAKEVRRISADLGKAIERFCGGSTTLRLVDCNAPAVETEMR